MKEYLVVGKLLKSRGLAGEIAVYPYAEDPARFRNLRHCRLESQTREFIRELSIKHVSIAGDRVFLRFEGVDSRDAADKLTGCYLSVPRAEAVPLEENSWYVADLIGCRVFDRERGELGTLTQVISNKANDLLLVRNETEKDLYIPFLKALLDKVDPLLGEIHLRLPEGLYEIYRGES